MRRLLLAAWALAWRVDRDDGGARRRRSRSERCRCRERVATYVPFFTWNGAYVGINAGYGFGSSQWTDTVTQASTNKFSTSGGLIGGTVGYNLQLGSSRGRPRGRHRLERHQGLDHDQLRHHLRDQQQLARHGARPHRLCVRSLPALLHRAAPPSARSKARSLGFGSFSETKVGWTIGGGLEYAFAQQLVGQARISLRRSRQGDLQRGLLRRQSVRTSRSRPTSCAAA